MSAANALFTVHNIISFFISWHEASFGIIGGAIVFIIENRYGEIFTSGGEKTSTIVGDSIWVDGPCFGGVIVPDGIGFFVLVIPFVLY